MMLFDVRTWLAASLVWFAALAAEENPMTPEFLYKVVSPSDWAASQAAGEVVPSPIDTDFFHLATEEQVPHVVAKFWCKADVYVLLKLKPTLLTGSLKFETNPGGSTKYYHLYKGRIPIGAVVSSETIQNKEQCPHSSPE